MTDVDILILQSHMLLRNHCNEHHLCSFNAEMVFSIKTNCLQTSSHAFFGAVCGET